MQLVRPSYFVLIRIQNIITYVLLIECKKFVRVRDTFAGKIISETREVKTISEKWSDFYRQKCRAGVRTKLLFLVYTIR